MMELPDDISPDLVALVERRKNNQVLLDQYKDLHKRVQKLKKAQESHAKEKMHIDYDLGQGFTCEAIIHDSAKINIQLGTSDNLIAHLTIDEAADFCVRKVDLLYRTDEALAKQENDLRQDLQVITGALKQAVQRMQPQES